jgi:hypothetical protein
MPRSVIAHDEYSTTYEVTDNNGNVIGTDQEWHKVPD